MDWSRIVLGAIQIAALTAGVIGMASVASPPLLASDDFAISTLRGINAIHVIVEGINPDAVKDGLSIDQLKTDAELRLRKAGIVVSDTSSPYVYVRVTLVKAVGSNQYAYDCHVSLEQIITVKANQVVTMAATWSRGTVGLAGSQRMTRVVRDEVSDLVDEFANAFLSVNPK